jgi:hypothetical protein
LIDSSVYIFLYLNELMKQKYYLYKTRVCWPSINNTPLHIWLHVSFLVKTIDCVQAASSSWTRILRVLSECNNSIQTIPKDYFMRFVGKISKCIWTNTAFKFAWMRTGQLVEDYRYLVCLMCKLHIQAPVRGNIILTTGMLTFQFVPKYPLWVGERNEIQCNTYVELKHVKILLTTDT